MITREVKSYVKKEKQEKFQNPQKPEIERIF